jgi:hypothetical protein
MRTWATPCGEMLLPDDIPSSAFKENGHIAWSHKASALVNAYIKGAYDYFANMTPEERRNDWVPTSFVSWVSAVKEVKPDMFLLLNRPQNAAERLANGARQWKHFKDDVGAS